MTTESKIPVLKKIILKGRNTGLSEDRSSLQDHAVNHSCAPAKNSSCTVNKVDIDTLRYTTHTNITTESQNEQEKELHTQAEVLLGIMEEVLGIYLIRKRKKLLDALVQQLDSYRG